jgi:sterol desaturase/sphingolipid hydroxylase (fatty acid hydroxylase superfamily)
MKETSLASLAVTLLILAAFFFVIERILGRGRKQSVIRKGWFTDVTYWFLTPFVTKQLVRLALIAPLLVLVAAHITSVEALKAMTYSGFGPLSRQPMWLQAMEVYVLGDFMAYWSHRLFHRGRWWPFHAVHHSTEELDWLGSLRVHPVNDLVNKLAQVTPILFLGFHPLVTASSAVFLTLYAIFLHANVNWDFGPLRSVIASPVFHRWHHSKDREAWDKNFAGLLPLWDILFGTYYMPKGRYPENFGIEEPMPEGFIGQMAAPFVWKKQREQ